MVCGDCGNWESTYTYVPVFTLIHIYPVHWTSISRAPCHLFVWKWLTGDLQKGQSCSCFIIEQDHINRSFSKTLNASQKH